MISTFPAKTVKSSSDDTYRALLRCLRRTKNFGIVFVQCSPETANRLIFSLKNELIQKTTSELNLTKSIDNLFELVSQKSESEKFDILFIKGLEESLQPYIEKGYGGDGDYYNLNTVPRILSHLNQQRENFRDYFGSVCFLFILPKFAIKYIVRRAPDFFDWSTGIFDFSEKVENHHEASNKNHGDTQFFNLKNNQIWYDRSNESLRIGDYKKALLFGKVGAWTEALEKNPNDPESLYHLGYSLNSVGKYQEALTFFRKLTKLKPDHQPAWFQKGYALDKSGLHAEAITSYNKALELDSVCQSALNNRGVSFIHLKQYQHALLDLDKAIELNPNDELAWNNRGFALLNSERFPEALHDFDKALGINPEYYNAIDNRIAVLNKFSRSDQKKYYKKRLNCIKKNLKTNSKNHKRWFEQGIILRDLNCYDEAISCFDKALEINSSHLPSWFQRGFALGELDRHEEAIVSYNKVLQLDPTDQAALNNRGYSLINLQQYHQALLDLDKAVEINSNDKLAWNNRGWALLNLERFPEALYDFDKALEIDPEYSNAINNRLNTLSKISKSERLNYYVSVSQNNPENHMGWFEQGIILRDLSRYDEAISCFDKALKITPNHLPSCFQRGFALAELGRHEEAIASYNKVLQLDPTDQVALNNRGYSLNNLQQYQQALLDLDKAVEINSNDKLAWNNRGWALLNLERFLEALHDFDKSLEIDSEYSKAINNRFDVLRKITITQQLEYYTSFSKSNPKNYKGWFNKGIALMNLFQYEKASLALNEALKLNPLDALAWFHQGRALGNLGKNLDAINSYSKSLELNPYNYTALSNYSYSLVKLHRFQEALMNAEKSLKIQNNNEYAWNNKAAALLGLKKYKAALAANDKSLEINPEFQIAQKTKDLIHQFLSLDELSCYYTKKLNNSPKKHLILISYGKLLSQHEKLNEALSIYNRAVGIEADDCQFMTNQDIALINSIHSKETIAAYCKPREYSEVTSTKKILKLKLNSYKDWFDRGAILFRLGRNQEAVNSFNIALELRSNFFYKNACFYALQSNLEDAIANLSRAIALSPDEYREMAKTDSDFDAIRDNEEFQALIAG